MQYYLLLLLLCLVSCNPVRNGAFLWAIKGNCDFVGGNCVYVPGSLTTCGYTPAACFEVIQKLANLSSNKGVDFVAIQLVPS